MRTITAEWLRLRWVILERDDFTCQYCGRRAPEVQLQVDHRLPVVEGGTDVPDNLVTACYSCNQGKEYSRWTLVNLAATKPKPASPIARSSGVVRRDMGQCAVCGTAGANTIGWAYPASGFRDEGWEAPMHKGCISGRDQDYWND